MTIAAIIPVFNGAQFIERAIESIRQQQFPVTEILVIDDCSTDNTPAIVRAISAVDPRVRLLSSSVNSGPAICRNLGMAATSCRISAFLDADDYWLEDHAALLQKGFDTFPDAALVFCSCSYESHRLASNVDSVSARVLSDPLTVLLEDNVVPQSAAAVVTASALSVGGYRAGGRYAEDYDLWVRLALAGQEFVEMQTVSVIRTRHENQVSETHIEALFSSAWNVRRTAVLEKFNRLESIDPSVVQILLRAEARDLETAFHLRRRELVRHTLSTTAWIPYSESRLDSARKRAGWQWPIWRMTTVVYDGLPDVFKTWWRERRRTADAA